MKDTTEMRICKTCGIEKYVMIDFWSDPKNCKACLTVQRRNNRWKRDGMPERPWGFFNIAPVKRSDPRDTILRLE